jgi:hypothetical protein
MKTLTSTLLAAQRKPDRLPYVEAKVYDFEQGIKRLEWTRLYEGTEPDNHHGIAFDSEGSMHRIRADGNNLYHQKVSNPGEASDFSQWTQIATDCAGPCAIAAYGAKVYIFYKTTANGLWKYYSQDYGQTWSDAQLVAYADVCSMAACWWSTGNIVICFALKANEINGIVLDTLTQATSQHIQEFKSESDVHILTATYGIGATYDAGICLIVFAAKETACPGNPYPYDTYNLFRTQFDSTYHFLAIKSFLMSPYGEGTTYEYPDCHIPASPEDYESIQITAVEKFSGTTAYSRPLTCHLVKDADFSDAAFTQPKPHPVIASGAWQSHYGLRIASSLDYWWLERPNGIWRAPRAAGTPLDLTTDILSLTQHVGAGFIPALTIELDNSKGQYATPPKKRSEVVLKLGYKTTAGNEAVEVGRYWIDSWEYSSHPNQSLFTIHCINGSGLASRWTARYQLSWGQVEFPGYTVWQILQTLLCRWGIKLWEKAGVPRSSAIDNFYPAFTLPPGTKGDAATRRLLSFISDALIYDGNVAYTKDLRADEASCYCYGTEPGDHVILSGEYREESHLSRARAIGRDDEGNRIVKDAFDWDALKCGIDILEQDYDPNLNNATHTQERADAILRRESLRAQRGNLVIPTNVGQELYDVITVTDKRCGISSKKYRVLAIQTDYNRPNGTYNQKLTIGAP